MFTLKIDSEFINRPQIEIAILDFLAAQGPGSLDEICTELQYQLDVMPGRLLPMVVTALAAMQEQGTIRQYDEEVPLDTALECAWEVQ